jgi:hypothetical protein
MKVTIEKDELVIRISLQKPTPSKSGKTMVVATTGGFIQTDAKVDGKVVAVSLNATIR